jgi:hypothetical protein
MPTDLTWECSWPASWITTQRSRDGDRVLWRVAKDDRTMTCREREIRTATYVGLELRVEHNGQVYRTEVHT